jgi:hypothetical protein
MRLEALDLRLPSTRPADLHKDRPILVTGIEQVLERRSWRRELETLLTSERKSSILLVSEIDPLHYFVSRSHDVGAADDRLNRRSAAGRIGCATSSWRFGTGPPISTGRGRSS